MKFFELESIKERFKSFKLISRARRVEDNTIELSFDNGYSYFFDMRRGSSTIYKTQTIRPPKSYNAPFDKLLHLYLANALILDIELLNNDRILRFYLQPKSNYKDEKIYLQFEFTGKHTNAILIDENQMIIEALRHIDAQSSFRIIRPSVELLPLVPYHKEHKKGRIEDVDTFLSDIFASQESKKLESIKAQKIALLEKKIQKLSHLRVALPSENELISTIQTNQNYANLVLANLYQLKPYSKTLSTYDFDGNEIMINLPKDTMPNRMSEHFFNLAKRAKNREKNLYIEQENLDSKIAFYENIQHTIKEAQDSYEIEFLAPKRSVAKKKKAKLKEGELFWIDNYKVLIGRNQKENIAILKMAKANDIWMHIRDIPSSHLIIMTDKQNLPDELMQKVAKLCVDFSIKNAGNYEVDYTKRKFVKIQEGANVQYDKYKTIVIKKG